MSKKFTTITAVLAAAGLLAACSPQEKQPEEPQEQASGQETTEVSDDEKYDAGPYRSEPHRGWKETPDNLGVYIELVNIGHNVLLPYEVDEQFVIGRGPREYLAFEALNPAFPDAVAEKLGAFESNFITGWAYSADNEDQSHLAENYVLRMTDPTSAENFAATVRDNYLAAGGENFLEHTTYPLEYQSIPGHPDAAGMLDIEGEKLHMVTTHNEFVIMANLWAGFGFDEGPAGPTGSETPTETEAETETEGPADPASLEWMSQYMSTFLTKQLPLIDTIQTHKTEEGYGKNDGWQPIDPDDILRYVVMQPEGVARVGTLQKSANKRMMVGHYRDVPGMSAAIDQAKPEAMALGETSLFRMKNPEIAELMRASFRAMDVDGEPEKYDEPQNIPDTECYSSYTTTGKRHYCYMVFDNYFAQGGITETTTDTGKTETSSNQAPKVDPKTQLSQVMAAQYLTLKKAAEGWKPEDSTSQPSTSQPSTSQPSPSAGASGESSGAVTAPSAAPNTTARRD